MASNISNMLNNSLRITGMASGLDTEGMVKKLMAGDQAKLNKLRQDKQLIEWRRDAYRDITSVLRGFSTQYFDIVNPATNLRSESTFSAVSIKYNNADSSEYFSVTGGASAKPGNYTISNITMAEAAKVTSGAVAGTVKSEALSTAEVNAIQSTSDNNRITITFNGVSKDIVMGNNPADITALKTDLQSKIDAAFGVNPDASKKITVGTVADGLDHRLTFASSGTNTFSISASNNFGYRDIFTKDISSGITVNEQNNKFKITLGSDTKSFELTPGTVYANGDDLAAAIQSAVDDGVTGFGADQVRVVNQGGRIITKAVGSAGSAAGNLAGVSVPTGSSEITIDGTNHSMSVTIGGVTKNITLADRDYTGEDLLAAIQARLDAAFGSNKSIVSADGAGNLRFESVSATDRATASAVENKGLEAIGMNAVNQSNKINLNAKLIDIKDNFSTPLSLDLDPTISFTVNGKSFSFDSTETSLSQIMSKVNADSGANVKMSYDEITNKITIQSKTMGSTAVITTTDTAGGLFTSLGLVAADVRGKDASITIDDGVNGPQQVVRPGNTFSVNGMQFDLKKNTVGPVNLSVSGDTNKIYDLIKGFVTKYNEVVDKINTELSEKKYKEYLPLTEEQRSAMKEEDIKLWEDKAKSGILKSEDALKNVANNLRKVLYDPIYTDSSDKTTALSQSLYSIGITTGAYQDKGKLIINETKLRDAIAKTPEKVVQLFTADSSVSYSEAMNDPSARAKRYGETGLANRLYDVLQDNIRTIRSSNGKKGILLEKAGMDGDLTDVKNTFKYEIDAKDTLIDTLTEKMYAKENAYYKKFSAMESAMSKMNSQSSWLSQQFGGS